MTWFRVRTTYSDYRLLITFGMDLPDRFEQVGIVVGSVIVVTLPVSALVTALYGTAAGSWEPMLFWLIPGLVVGLLVANGSLPVSFDEIWSFSLSSWLLTLAGWAALGLSTPVNDRSTAVLVWGLAIAVGTLVAWVRPLRSLFTQVRST